MDLILPCPQQLQAMEGKGFLIRYAESKDIIDRSWSRLCITWTELEVERDENLAKAFSDTPCVRPISMLPLRQSLPFSVVPRMVNHHYFNSRYGSACG